jgi:ABC-type transport system involved in multi-copper enzyme maturation permease subunit
MVGPVFALELLHASRRGRQHRFRLAYGGWLGAQFSIFAALYLIRLLDNLTYPTGWAGNPSPLSELIGYFLVLLVLQQCLLLVLGLPAFAAGTITEEKTRGTLQLLLTTTLTPAEIVTGKLLGQLFRIVDLSLPGWLLVCFVGALGGVDPLQLVALVGGFLAPLPALGAAGLLASVWCRRTANAAMGVYALSAVAGAVLWARGDLTSPAGPLSFLGVRAGPVAASAVLRELLFAWLASIGVAIPLLALAAWRLRPAYVRQLTATPRLVLGRWALAGRPPVDDHPVRWKEQYVERVLDVPGLRLVPRWAGVAAVFALALVTSLGIQLSVKHAAGPAPAPLFPATAPLLWTTLAPGWSYAEALGVQGLAVMFLIGLAAGARACGTVSGERERQTWDALLLTPLTAKQLVRAKHWGTINVFRPYLAAYTIPAVALSLVGGPKAVVWTVGCWVLTWVMMYFMVASGIACSVRSASSWKSWLATLFGGYRGLLGRFFLLGLPLGLLLGAAVWLGVCLIVWAGGGGPGQVAGLMTGAVDYFPVLPCLVTAVFVFARSEQLLMEAEMQLARSDRIAQRLRVRPALEATAVGRP